MAPNDAGAVYPPPPSPATNPATDPRALVPTPSAPPPPPPGYPFAAPGLPPPFA